MTPTDLDHRIRLDPRKIAALCDHYRIKSLRFFGSILRDDFTDASDVDVLVEFESGVDPDLFELGGIQQDLSDLLAREVDLKIPAMFSPANLHRVLGSSVLSYAA